MSSPPRCVREGGGPMAEVIWGLTTSHVPSIGAAMDRGKTQDPYWKPLFDGYQPAREWMAEHIPDIALVIYNDHANAIDPDIVPTFAIGTAEQYNVADEGFGRRPVPDVVGSPELSLHLVKSLIDEGFDLTVFQELDVDHGLTVPLSIFFPNPGDAWPCTVVPLLVNVVQYPQPTAARCYALGQAIGRAIASFQSDAKIAVFGTGGMSHQLAGARAGYINPTFDKMFLEKIETDPESLAALTREDYIEQAGSEGIELIMWLVMRGAMNPQIRRVHDFYHVPASNTAAALAVFDNRVPQAA
jgi:protocatechuate 4,5-dioxygenase, beta chain